MRTGGTSNSTDATMDRMMDAWPASLASSSPASISSPRLLTTRPEAFRAWFASAKEFNALNVIERNGRLLGRLTLTLDVPEPQGIHPVGIDLNETNALVAVDAEGRTLCVSGKAIKVANARTRKTRARLQRRRFVLLGSRAT